MLLGLTGHLLHKATSPRSRNVTNLPNRNKNRDSGKIRQKRNMFQMKEQYKTLEEELSEVEISNLPNKELKVIIIKMLNKRGRRTLEKNG